MYKFQVKDTGCPDVLMVLVNYEDRVVTRQQKSTIIRMGMRSCVDADFEKEYRYSISHTDRYSVAVLSKECKVGIDIEKKSNITKRSEGLDMLFPRDCSISPTIRWCLHEVIGKIESTGLNVYYPILSCEHLPDQKLCVCYGKADREQRVEIEFLENAEYVMVLGYAR